MYIYIYISHCGCFLPRFTKDLHRLLLPGVDFFLEEVLPSKLKPRATNRAADLIFLSRDFLLPHFPLCRNGRRTGNGSREHPRQTKRRGRDTFVEWLRSFARSNITFVIVSYHWAMTKRNSENRITMFLFSNSKYFQRVYVSICRTY